ncbi:hypothetical protein E4O00_07285 [Treponema sp. OMZ 788]|uniref:hypothetical protein n=1 Tax=Treponema sp. OMZ 788 TaxID=2563664 RepID=UPI0020A56AB6|nr:hypothetical protein [Treponema sp. OMZ 788]UTC63746.1 hypothetical protein E4O00_07285 [Treponema sp. OMZ 788]
MAIIDESIDFIHQTFPEVSIYQEASSVIFEGRFILRGRYKDFIMEAAPRLKLVMDHNYPHVLPKVFDVDDAVKYDHKFQDNSLCLATPIDIRLRLLSSKNISDYIDDFLIPYFISYKYWEQSGKKIDIYGDRSHGKKGIIESLADFFNLDCNDEITIRLLFSWAAKVNKFKKLIPKEKQYGFIQKYSNQISKLRKLGMMELKRYYKCFIKVSTL